MSVEGRGRAGRLREAVWFPRCVCPGMGGQEGSWVTAADTPWKTPDEEASREPGPERNEELGNASEQRRS